MHKHKKTFTNFILAAIVFSLAVPFVSHAQGFDPSELKFMDGSPANQPQTQPATNPTPTPAVLGASTPLAPAATSTNLQDPYLIQKIKEAKQLLADVKQNYQLVPVYTTNKKTKKKTLSSYKLGLRDLFVAVLDPATGNISITGAMQNGKSLTFPDKNYDIKLTNFNGVNSRFQVSAPAGGQVIALKYLITPVESGSKAAIENAMYPAIYVPYSSYLATPEVTAYGANYFNNVIQTVTNQLQHLPSVSIPGKTITEAIPPSMIKALAYAEHTEAYAVLNSPNPSTSLNQMNILLAGNEGDTYKYSVSNDGFASRGIAQFVKSTYDSVVSSHPEAGLIPDFKAGMEDHVNSVKAMYLLLDDYASTVRQKGSLGFVEGRVFDYGAAAYNAGPVRVARAVNMFGQNWNADRSGEINTLKAQVNSLTSQVNSLKKQIKKTTDKKKKATLQAQLTDTQSQLNTASQQLEDLDNATLRSVTVAYMQKIYKVISLFNNEIHTASINQ